jgi:hypothetical protein
MRKEKTALKDKSSMVNKRKWKTIFPERKDCPGAT